MKPPEKNAGARFSLSHFRRLFILTTALAAATFGASASAIDSPLPPALRLARDPRPVRYAVSLTIRPEEETFSGSIDIELELTAPTSLIWLNAKKIDVSHVSLVAGGKTIPAKIVPGGDEFLGVALDSPAPAGHGRLHFDYRGELEKTATHGLFREQEANDWYAFSQFEATDARRAFPCFDEPDFKTPWQLTLHVRKEHLAFSNTPAVLEKDEPDGMKRVVFAETKPLPSYLVALGVGPLEAVDAGVAGKNKTALRVLVPRGRKDHARYAAATIPELLGLLEEYFGIPYPYEKLDSLAIPQTVGFGAMENPGLITYSSTLLLARPEDVSLRFQRHFASVAAHEMAHQWFGDLVTMSWWDDIWLNESFASWMESKIIAKWKPKWGETIDRVASRSWVLSEDTLLSARRIRQPIVTKDDIVNAFDGITYQKGEALLSMIESFMGEESFRRGVRRHLERHSHGNATTDDFLASLGEQDKTIPAIFSTFLDQPGAPMVSAELRCANGAPPRLALMQKRFLPLGSKGAPAEQTWRIPVRVRYRIGGKEKSARTVLTEKSTEITLGSAPGCPDWVLANEGESGYYRTIYKGGLSSKLLAGNAPRTTLPERVGIIGDSHALAKSGDISIGDALAFVPIFSKETDRHLVSEAAAIASSVKDHLVPAEQEPAYARFIEANFGKRARELGWKPRAGEDDDRRLLRTEIIGLAAAEGSDPSLRMDAARLARSWLEDRNSVDPDLRQTILWLAARDGDHDLFDRYVAKARSTEDRREKRALFESLGAIRNPAIEREALSLVLSDSLDIRESFGIARSAMSHPQTREIAWNFVKENIDTIVARLPFESRAYLPYFGSSFCDESRRAEVEAFFKDRVGSWEGAQRNLAQTLEEIELCRAFREAQEASVVEFLKRY